MIRYNPIYTYPDDLTPEEKVPKNAIITYEPYEVSDEQLYQEKLDDEFNAGHVKVLQAVNNWDKVTLKQKDDLLKLLARFYLYVMKKSYNVETGLEGGRDAR